MGIWSPDGRSCCCLGCCESGSPRKINRKSSPWLFLFSLCSFSAINLLLPFSMSTFIGCSAAKTSFKRMYLPCFSIRNRNQRKQARYICRAFHALQPSQKLLGGFRGITEKQRLFHSSSLTQKWKLTRFQRPSLVLKWQAYQQIEDIKHYNKPSQSPRTSSIEDREKDEIQFLEQELHDVFAYFCSYWE